MNFKQKILLLKNNAEVMKYVSNTSWLLGDKVLRLLVSFFVGIWVIRYLGPERYGVFSYVTSFVGLFLALATLGLDSFVVKYLINKKYSRDTILGTAFSLKLTGSIAIFFILAFTTLFTSEDHEVNFYCFIIATSIIFQSFNVIDFYFQSKVQSRFVIYARTFAFTLTSLAKIILIINQAPLIYFIYIVLLDAIIVAIGLCVFYYRHDLSLRNWKFDKLVGVNLLKDSWPLILSGIAISIGLRIDQVMIKHFLELKDVGAYAAGVKLAEVLMFVPMVISQSIFPKLVEIDFKKSENYLISLIRNIFYPLIFIVMFLSLLSEYFITMLYGEEYSSAGIVFSILLWTIPMTFLGTITNKLLLVQNCQKIIFYKQLTLMLVNVILNIIFIPKYGIIGAALATLFADIVINMFFDLLFKKSRWVFKLKFKALLGSWGVNNI